jgi:phosphoribosyl-AMP cyclohydrolase
MVQLDFDRNGGLVPVVAQEQSSGEVLMLAYMNQESWELTLKTGLAHYWSRSRARIWKKGESSGNVQEVREIRVDCDGDAVLLKVLQRGGAACHTGHRSCFFRVLRDGALQEEGEMLFDPAVRYRASS